MGNESNMKHSILSYTLIFVSTQTLYSCSGVSKGSQNGNEIVDNREAFINLDSRANELRAKGTLLNIESGAENSILKKFECIVDIVTYTNSLLATGESPSALVVSKFGMLNFGYDGRIQNNFEKSLDVFKASTQMLLDSKEDNCVNIQERMNFLRSIVPDTSFQKNRCDSETSPIYVSSKFDFEMPRPFVNNENEIKAYETVGKKIKYLIRKNNEDNYNEILYHGILAWEGLSFYSTQINLSKDIVDLNQKIDLSITTITSYERMKMKEFCDKLLHRFTDKSLTRNECRPSRSGGSRSFQEYFLGTKNQNTFELNKNRFFRLLPYKVVFSLNIIQASGEMKNLSIERVMTL